MQNIVTKLLIIVAVVILATVLRFSDRWRGKRLLKTIGITPEKFTAVSDAIASVHHSVDRKERLERIAETSPDHEWIVWFHSLSDWQQRTVEDCADRGKVIRPGYFEGETL